MNRCRAILSLAAVGLLAAMLPGCVERRIVLASDPEGAIVLLNDVEVGRTPVSVPFEWYGDYDVRIRLEKNVGTPENPIIKHYYLHTHRKTETPWFQILGVDLFTEILPVQYKDEQIWAFNLEEVPAVPDDVLLQRAKELKDMATPAR